MSPQRIPPSPAVLRLVQMVVLGRWRATGEQLYREVAELIAVKPGQEVLVAACGEGVTTEWLAARTGASVTGVDPDQERIETAERRMRARETPLPLSYQQAPLNDLPHESAVFDAVVGEPGLASATDPARAVGELARVLKPMGTLVLLQLTWNAELSPEARELLVERLGLRPHLVVEWKQMLRDAGIVEIQVQDWTSGAPGGERARPAEQDPQLTWQEKVQIAGRAWRQWKWREARHAIEREETLLRELSKERSIGFQVIRGVKWPHARTP
jgi:2-polyprenyl-3-methyl-5-hydroxy-6-metoxy-1,4-benzoquinol methylase